MRSAHAGLAITLWLAAGFGLTAAILPDGSTTATMQKFLAESGGAHSYRASRRLEAAGSGQEGWLDARTDFTTDAGFAYEVTAEGGSGYIRSRVLRSLLEEERRLIARGGSSEVAITPANYSFKEDGSDEAGLARVMIQPLRKERPLIAGRMFIRPDSGELVRVEGRLAKNPSFWISRVDVVRSYRRINGALVPVLLESTAQVRLLGQSTLRMTYRYSEINNLPITGEGERDDLD